MLSWQQSTQTRNLVQAANPPSSVSCHPLFSVASGITFQRLAWKIRAMGGYGWLRGVKGGKSFQRLYNLDGQIGAEVLCFIKPCHALLLYSRLMWACTNLKQRCQLFAWFKLVYLLCSLLSFLIFSLHIQIQNANPGTDFPQHIIAHKITPKALRLC